MKKYDFHSHLGKTRSGDENDIQQLYNQLSKFNIKKVGIVSLSADSMEENNNIIFNAMNALPNFVVGYADIDPKSKNAHKEIDRTLGYMKMNGVKFMSWKHGYNVENCPQLDDVIDHIIKYNVHIQIHGGASPLCTPIVWLKYAKRYPKHPFVFTHICGREFGYTCIEAIKNIGNFYVETSANMEADILFKAKQVLGSKRMLFGSDWPYKPTNIEIDKLYLLGFSDEELEDVFYKNAEKLWGYKENKI